MYKLKPDNYTKSYINYKDGFSYMGNINQRQTIKRISIQEPIKTQNKKPNFDKVLYEIEEYKRKKPNLETKVEKTFIENEEINNTCDKEEIELEKDNDTVKQNEIKENFGEIGGITKKIKKN